MHIRCKSCHGTIWIESQGTAEQALEFRCKGCAQQYCVKGLRRLRSGEARYAKEARRIAERNGVDMPGAYSVLFGILTAHEVRELGHPGSTACRTGKETPPATQSENALSYDKAFQPAIDDGILSVYQAGQRGQRSTYAAMTASRYHLPMAAAYEIADNKLSLLNCLRMRNSSGRDAVPVTLRPPADRRPALIGAGLLLAVAMALLFRQSLPEVAAEAPVTRTVLGAEVQTDHRGRVLRVAAASPRTVLAAYCASLPARTMEPIDVVLSARYGGNVRVGLLGEKDAKNVYMIQIVEDRVAGGWVAGDGAVPILPKEAPQGAAALRAPKTS